MPENTNAEIAPFNNRWLRIALVIAFLLPLIVYAFNGQYARLLADDFCFTNRAREYGLPGVLVYYHNNWQATFSTTALQAAVGLIGVTATRILPSLLTAALWLGLLWFFYEIAKTLTLLRPFFVALVMASAASFAVLDGVPNLVQSLYWTSGSATYISPCVVLSIFGALLLRTCRLHPGKPAPGITALCTLLAVLACGFNPTYNAFQIVLFTLLALLVWRFAPPQIRKTALPILIAGLIASIAVLIFTLAAPGTAVRAARQPERLPMGEIISMTITGSLSLIAAAIVAYGPFSLLAVFIFAGGLGYLLSPRPVQFVRRRWRMILLTSLGVLLLLVLACSSTAVFTSADYLPARGFTVPQFALVLTVVLWGYVMGVNLRTTPALPRLHPALLAVLIVLVALGPILGMITALQFTPKAATFAQEWDERDSYLRSEAVSANGDAVVPPFTVEMAELAWIEPVGPDPTRGMNICAAEYYSLASLTVR